MDSLLHKEDAIRETAINSLRRLTGEYFGYHHDLPRKECEAAAERWAAWWRDAGHGRPRERAPPPDRALAAAPRLLTTSGCRPGSAAPRRRDHQRLSTLGNVDAITIWHSGLVEPRHVARLAALKSPWCTTDLAKELLGIDLVADPKLAAAVRSWAASFRGDGLVVRPSTSGPEVHRHALEAFLLQNGLISWKWAAIYVGLEAPVLEEVVNRLEARGDLVQVRSEVSDQLVRQREAASLFRAFLRCGT